MGLFERLGLWNKDLLFCWGSSNITIFGLVFWDGHFTESSSHAGLETGRLPVFYKHVWQKTLWVSPCSHLIPATFLEDHPFPYLSLVFQPLQEREFLVFCQVKEGWLVG